MAAIKAYHIEVDEIALQLGSGNLLIADECTSQHQLHRIFAALQ